MILLKFSINYYYLMVKNVPDSICYAIKNICRFQSELFFFRTLLYLFLFKVIIYIKFSFNIMPLTLNVIPRLSPLLSCVYLRALGHQQRFCKKLANRLTGRCCETLMH